MRIVCISDTHNCNEQVAVPDGDLLIHSGDATITGRRRDQALQPLVRLLPHPLKIFCR